MINANMVIQSEIISKVIYGIVDHESEMKVYHRHGKSGSYDPRFVDWMIKKGSNIVAIINGKRADMNEGVVQGIIHIIQSLQQNKNNKNNDMPMFGIISTGIDWAIIRVTLKDSSIKDVNVYLSSRSPLRLPINEQVLTRDDLLEPIENLLGQIKWVFNQNIK
jgi:hypothetical protein